MAERSTPSCVDYWDDFYSEGGPGYVDTYEWYLLYPDIRPFLVANLPAEGQRILHIGTTPCCGNSVVGEKIVNDPELPTGVTVVNIDNCELIVEKMRERQREAYSAAASASTTKQSGGRGPTSADKKRRAGGKSGHGGGAAPDIDDMLARCTYELMSVENMTLEENSFDLCLDKGCLDALLSTGEAEEGTNETIQQMMREVYRVLKPGAKFLIFSKNDSFITNPYFYISDEVDWEVQADTFDRSTVAAGREGKKGGGGRSNANSNGDGSGGPGGATLARTFYLYTLTSCKPE